MNTKTYFSLAYRRYTAETDEFHFDKSIVIEI